MKLKSPSVIKFDLGCILKAAAEAFMELQASAPIKEWYQRLLQWPGAGRAGSEPGTAVGHPS